MQEFMGNGNAGTQIADILTENSNPSIQKAIILVILFI